jgi:hypothetical protein
MDSSAPDKGGEAAFAEMEAAGLAVMFVLANTRYLAAMVDNEMKIFEFTKLGLENIGSIHKS